MTLADDLVAAAACAIAEAKYPQYNRKFGPRRPSVPDERYARAAVEATVRLVVARLRADGATGTPDWRDAYGQAANDLEMLADEVAAVSTVVQVAGEQNQTKETT